MPGLRLVIGSDEAGFAYKEILKIDLLASKYVAEVKDIGTTNTGSDPYPQIALTAGELVSNDQYDRAILICGTGLGMAISANKVRGIFAVTAHDSYSVERSILSNNVQILCLGQRVIGIELARKLVGEWLALSFDEHSPSADKLQLITSYENERVGKES